MSQVVAPHPRGLPSVLFIEDEQAFLDKTGMTEEQAALEMRSAFQSLRQLSEQLLARREALAGEHRSNFFFFFSFPFVLVALDVLCTLLSLSNMVGFFCALPDKLPATRRNIAMVQLLKKRAESGTDTRLE